MRDNYTKYSSTQFYAQTDRYGVFRHTVVAVITHHEDNDDVLRDAVDDLEGGDGDAFDARDLLTEQQSQGNLSIGVGASFSEAATNVDKAYGEWYAAAIS